MAVVPIKTPYHLLTAPTFLQVPKEVQLFILFFLSVKDLKAVRILCKRTKALVEEVGDFRRYLRLFNGTITVTDTRIDRMFFTLPNEIGIEKVQWLESRVRTTLPWTLQNQATENFCAYKISPSRFVAILPNRSCSHFEIDYETSTFRETPLPAWPRISQDPAEDGNNCIQLGNTVFRFWSDEVNRVVHIQNYLIDPEGTAARHYLKLRHHVTCSARGGRTIFEKINGIPLEIISYNDPDYAKLSRWNFQCIYGDWIILRDYLNNGIETIHVCSLISNKKFSFCPTGDKQFGNNLTLDSLIFDENIWLMRSAKKEGRDLSVRPHLSLLKTACSLRLNQATQKVLASFTDIYSMTVDPKGQWAEIRGMGEKEMMEKEMIVRFSTEPSRSLFFSRWPWYLKGLVAILSVAALVKVAHIGYKFLRK